MSDLSIKCLRDGCDRIQGRTRGLCSCCYRRVRKDIQKGKITEDQLVRSGQMLPRSHNPNWGYGEQDPELAQKKKAKT